MFSGRVLERLFTEGYISRRQLLAGLAACGLTAGAIELLAGCDSLSDVAALESPAAAHYLCLIVLDGFRPEYFQLAPTPAYDALAARGTVYTRAWVGQLESETPVGHATLSTGSLPRHDGVIGFEWRDPVSRREVLDGWEQGQMEGQIGRDMHRAHAHSVPLAIKQADPSARIVALSSEKIYAADAMGASAADSVLYHRYAGHRLVPASLPGYAPPAGLFAHPRLSLPLPLRRFSDWDDLATELALVSFQTIRPRALLINLPGADIYGHKYGGPASPKIMSRVVTGLDRGIGRIVHAYQRAGIGHRTLFVVTADHGMVPNHHVVGPEMVHAAVARAGAHYLFHTGGTAKYIYLVDKDRARARAVAQEMARIRNVRSSYYRAPDGQYERVNGSLDATLDAAHRHLLITFQGATAPDVVAVYRENTIGTRIPAAYGNHGGLSWGVQHVPLLLAGPGIHRGLRSSMPARLVDVAPTILRLLGLSLPVQDGTVLADALVAASAQDVAAQRALLRDLQHHQSALGGQAAEDLREDRKAGIHPPPRLPAQP